jgi:hypothetical protein
MGIRDIEALRRFLFTAGSSYFTGLFYTEP